MDEANLLWYIVFYTSIKWLNSDGSGDELWYCRGKGAQKAHAERMRPTAALSWSFSLILNTILR